MQNAEGSRVAAAGRSGMSGMKFPYSYLVVGIRVAFLIYMISFIYEKLFTG